MFIFLQNNTRDFLHWPDPVKLVVYPSILDEQIIWSFYFMLR